MGKYTWLSQMGQRLFAGDHRAAVVLPLLERISPHRLDWRPDSREWFTDALYTIVIQVAMPPLLALLVVLGLSDLTRPYLHSALWPHHWPLLAQGLLMVLLVDLMRYWMHRFAHTNPILWRLHAVHHSPDKLYWLNTARFHPLEKVLHFLFDSIPFILLGVNEYVLAFYFVCYAVNGFYQHSNVHLRLGLLNYISARPSCTAGTTRKGWRKPTTTTATPPSSGTSYSAPITVRTTGGWNGLASRTTRYPMRFGQQLIAPFVRNLESHDVFVPSLRQAALNLLLGFGFARINRTAWRVLEKASYDVAEAQKRVLHGILQQNRNTAFGQRHHFAEVNSIADYQRLCPVQRYDSLRPYIDEQENTGKPAITAESDVCTPRPAAPRAQRSCCQSRPRC